MAEFWRYQSTLFDPAEIVAVSPAGPDSFSVHLRGGSELRLSRGPGEDIRLVRERLVLALAQVHTVRDI